MSDPVCSGSCFCLPLAAQYLKEVKDLQPVLQFNFVLIYVSGTMHNPEMLRIPKLYYKETKYFENKYPYLRNKAAICSRIMILKYQAVVVNSADFPSLAFVQTVLPVNSQTAFGSSTYSQVSHTRIHEASWVLVCERNQLGWNDSKPPFTYSPLSFVMRCTMKNKLLLIKTNSLFKTQLEVIFIIKSPNLTHPKRIHFLTGPKQWWNFTIILVALVWPILCSQSIFLIQSTALDCLVLIQKQKRLILNWYWNTHLPFSSF